MFTLPFNAPCYLMLFGMQPSVAPDPPQYWLGGQHLPAQQLTPGGQQMSVFELSAFGAWHVTKPEVRVHRSKEYFFAVGVGVPKDG